jgi:hypothetical protein
MCIIAQPPQSRVAFSFQSSDESMLIASSPSGIWTGVPLAWDQSDRLDETRYAADIERCLALGRQESKPPGAPAMADG